MEPVGVNGVIGSAVSPLIQSLYQCVEVTYGATIFVHLKATNQNSFSDLMGRCPPSLIFLICCRACRVTYNLKFFRFIDLFWPRYRIVQISFFHGSPAETKKYFGKNLANPNQSDLLQIRNEAGNVSLDLVNRCCSRYVKSLQVGISPRKIRGLLREHDCS